MTAEHMMFSVRNLNLKVMGADLNALLVDNSSGSVTLVTYVQVTYNQITYAQVTESELLFIRHISYGLEFVQK